MGLFSKSETVVEYQLQQLFDQIEISNSRVLGVVKSLEQVVETVQALVDKRAEPIQVNVPVDPAVKEVATAVAEVREALTSLKFPELPAPQVTVEPPVVNVPAPVVHLEPPEVNVTVPEVKVPTVNVPRPEVTVQAPDVHVPPVDFTPVVRAIKEAVQIPEPVAPNVEVIVDNEKLLEALERLCDLVASKQTPQLNAETVNVDLREIKDLVKLARAEYDHHYGGGTAAELLDS